MARAWAANCRAVTVFPIEGTILYHALVKLISATVELAKMFVETVCEADKWMVQRSRAWCEMAGIQYFRKISSIKGFKSNKKWKGHLFCEQNLYKSQCLIWPHQKALHYTDISSKSLEPRNGYVLFNESHEMTIQIMLQISWMLN